MRRNGWWMLAVVVTLASVACSSAKTGSSGSVTTTSPADVHAVAASTPITVKDAYTSVTVTVLNAPTYPVLGTDQKYHVVYEVELQNASKVPATVEKFEVVDGTDPTKVLASYSGTQLVDPSCGFGDCNRLRALPSSPTQSAVIPAQEARVLYVDFTVDGLDQAPRYVLHHFVGTGADSPRPGDPAPIDYDVTPYDIGAGTPISIGPPVTGKNWIALNGCCEPGWPHRSSVAPFNGRLVNPQRFAIDWKQVNDAGDFYTGDKTKNESYVDYGSSIVAVADGTVVATLDTMDANAPGILPAADPVLAKTITVETVDGNHIVLDLGNGVYAFYAHLLKGSLDVKVGDKVTRGQKLAELGNTGNSNASHMHFHLMDGLSVLGSNGLPYVIGSFDYAGQIDPRTIVAADDYLSGSFFGAGRLSGPQPRTNELPLAWSIVNFPG